MKHVVFVCYGGGHVRMVVPVAQALRDRGLARVSVLGLTTAAQVVRDAGLTLVQVKDFVTSDDAADVARGHELAAALPNVIDPDETAAYLGLGYADLRATHGDDEAARQYAMLGRQALLPVRMMKRILQALRPDVLVATNSPRAERAAVIAAGELGIAAMCMVDLFAIDEVRWLGRPGYAQRICVLNEAVRQTLLDAGRAAAEIIVTGNPAFDPLLDPAQRAAGLALRQRQGWQGRRVLLWAVQDEPAVHPFDGRPGDPGLPGRVQAALVEWTKRHDDVVLCVRPRPGQACPALPDHARVVLTGQDWPLAPLLHAVDAVVTLNSTVGLEGHLAGASLVQVLGSVFDDAMPLARFGVADAAVPLDGLAGALDRHVRLRRPASAPQPVSASEPAPEPSTGPATGRVVQVLQTLMHAPA